MIHPSLAAFGDGEKRFYIAKNNDGCDTLVDHQYLLRIPRVAHLNTSINLDLRPNPTLIHYQRVTIADYGCCRLPQRLSLIMSGKLWQINGGMKYQTVFKYSSREFVSANESNHCFVEDTFLLLYSFHRIYSTNWNYFRIILKTDIPFPSYLPLLPSYSRNDSSRILIRYVMNSICELWNSYKPCFLLSWFNRKKEIVGYMYSQIGNIALSD